MEICRFPHQGLASWLVIAIPYLCMVMYLIGSIDAKMHYVLESWISKPSETSTTHYLVQIEMYQRHLTTAAFRLANGGDLNSSFVPSKPSRQKNVVTPALITKITKAFLDGICLMLDGMVLLASDDPYTAEGELLHCHNATIEDLNYLRIIDPKDSVRPS